MIPVTKPFLPPKEDYLKFLDGIWNRQWLTNNGPLVNELEMRLNEHLDIDHLLYTANGTVALQIAIKSLNLGGEIITTPFSYVATTSSIVWEGCKPVFVDIDKDSLNIDPKKIQEAITDKTSAILATHVYGNPCDYEAIKEVAEKNNIKVIYDAAHAFGVEVNGKSIFSYGDISTCSLHATKLFHSVEGGLLVTKNPELHKKMAYARNFGHNGPENYENVGINGKNSEYHAAMGLANLKYIKDIHNKRKTLSERYDKKLETFNAVKPKWHKDSQSNYAYYPLVFESEELLLSCIEVLSVNEIYGRRYFYPSLAKSLPYVDHKSFTYTDDIAKRIYCLPLYYDLCVEEVDLICRLLLRTQNN
jgi:dTDP-4-amino-4,6-dideoxygalactose transaminase